MTRGGTPLHGIGVDARYVSLEAGEGSEGAILARFGTSVVTITGNADQRTLAQIARAMAAHM